MIDKIMKRVEVDVNECWNWLGSKSRGYGMMHINKEYKYVHRLMWEIQNNKKIPDKMCICHHCDNPACVNPSHLFIGTKKDNAIDASNKGRLARGEKSGRAKLTREQVIKIRNDSRSQREIGKEYGISGVSVYLIRSRENWAWL